MSNKKQTAVEWLTDQLGIDGGTMRDNALAIERVELIRIDKLETLAKLLAKSWFYGNWEWENPNERVMQMLMQQLGYYPFKNEDEMIYHTRVDEDLYKESVDKVALINPRIIPVENHTVDTNEMIDHIGNTNKMVKQTAVEWLGYELNTSLFYDISPELWEKVNKVFEQALQMEREQIIDAAERWKGTYFAEQYYKQTYGGSK